MIDPKIQTALLVELHRSIAQAASRTVNSLGNPDASPDLGYPPNEELTFYEREALRSLKLSDHARTGLAKMVGSASADAVFHFFSVLDGVVDLPEYLDEERVYKGVWTGVALTQQKGEYEPMLHDDFYESYWAYKRKLRA